MTSTIHSSKPSDFSQADLREYAAAMLESEIHSAFIAVLRCRKEEDGLNQRDLAERMGKDETAVSKLVKGPRNWTLRTISEMCHALEVGFDFHLVDKGGSRIFTSSETHASFVELRGAGAFRARRAGLKNALSRRPPHRPAKRAKP